MLNDSYTQSQAKGTSSGNFFEFITWDFPGGGFYAISAFGDMLLMPEGRRKRLFLALGEMVDSGDNLRQVT